MHDPLGEPSTRPHGTPVNAMRAQRYARLAGILLLISIAAGAFGELYMVSAVLVPGDASATARNILTSNSLFRWAFALYLVEALCDVGLTWIFYLFFERIRDSLALLFVFFRLISTATFAFAELFFFAPTIILNAPYLKTFSAAQVNSLALLSLKLYAAGSGLFMVFYGVASILLGYLFLQSRYIPKPLAAFIALGGIGFVIRNFALVLAPAFSSDVFLLPTGVATLALALWLLVKGVDAHG